MVERWSLDSEITPEACRYKGYFIESYRSLGFCANGCIYFLSIWDHIHNSEAEVGVQQREVQQKMKKFAKQRLSFSNNYDHY